MFVDLFHVEDDIDFDIDFDRMGSLLFGGKSLAKFQEESDRNPGWIMAPSLASPPATVQHPQGLWSRAAGAVWIGFFSESVGSRSFNDHHPTWKNLQVVATWNIDAENPEFWWLFMAFHGFSTSMDCKRLQEGDIPLGPGLPKYYSGCFTGPGGAWCFLHFGSLDPPTVNRNGERLGNFIWWEKRWFHVNS